MPRGSTTKYKWIGGTEHVERTIQILREGPLKESICFVLGYGLLTVEKTNSGLAEGSLTCSLFCQSY